MSDEVLNIIYSTIDELNEHRTSGNSIKKNENTILLGKSSALDSLSLINFIVSVEQKIEEKFDKEISITDENTLTGSESPLNTVSSLTEHIEKLLK
jgi:acyl carrier protein